MEFLVFRIQDFHLLRFIFPDNSTILELFPPLLGPTTPTLRSVWASSFSLTTTKEIDFSFFSSGY